MGLILAVKSAKRGFCNSRFRCVHCKSWGPPSSILAGEVSGRPASWPTDKPRILLVQEWQHHNHCRIDHVPQHPNSPRVIQFKRCEAPKFCTNRAKILPHSETVYQKAIIYNFTFFLYFFLILFVFSNKKTERYVRKLFYFWCISISAGTNWHILVCDIGSSNFHHVKSTPDMEEDAFIMSNPPCNPPSPKFTMFLP